MGSGKSSTSWDRSLREVLREHNRMTFDRSKRAGEYTQAERGDVLARCFRDLHTLGFALKDVRRFRTKHLTALVALWQERGYKPATLQKYLSVLRVFCGWIGKAGMIGDSASIIPDPSLIRRSYAAQADKSWTAQEVDIRDRLLQVAALDPRVALQMELQLAFGLRIREACFLRPHLADNGTFLAVNWGTKGGRSRIVPIDTEYKRHLLARARHSVATKVDSMIPAGISWQQWRNHFYYVCHKCGISRAAGLTSHGLRHEYLNDLYESLTAVASPVRGGKPGGLPRDAQVLAQYVVAEHAGHGRPQITTAYTGSLRRRTK